MPEGTPARTRGKRKAQGNEEDDCGEHAIQPGSSTFHEPGDKDIGTERARRELEGERKGEDEQSRHHRLEAVDNADKPASPKVMTRRHSR